MSLTPSVCVTFFSPKLTKKCHKLERGSKDGHSFASTMIQVYFQYVPSVLWHVSNLCLVSYKNYLSLIQEFSWLLQLLFLGGGHVTPILHITNSRVTIRLNTKISFLACLEVTWNFLLGGMCKVSSHYQPANDSTFLTRCTQDNCFYLVYPG